MRGGDLQTSGIEIRFQIDPQLQDDEYRLECQADRALLIAGGTSGIFAAMGDYLLHCSFDGHGNWIPFQGNRSFRPKNPIHGMYFASHFQNFYEAAPIKRVYEVIEDLALRGCNAFMLWYDMH